MKTILSLAAVIALAGSASSQVLSEDFSTGVPPTGWVHVNNNAGLSVGWIFDSLFSRAWSEDEYGVGTADNTLVSPVFSLAGVSSTTLTFDSQLGWGAYLAVNGSGDGHNTMEISSDGGLTWTVAWDDVSPGSGSYPGISVDLSAFDGMAGLQLGIHFYGTYAQEWWVDNVVIDGGGAGLVYSTSGLVGGASATLTVSGATAGGGVLIGYSLTGAGPTNTPFGPVDMSNPITQLPVLTADGAGVASMTTMVPGRATGFTVYTQAADLTSSTLTNSLAEVVL
jgi:hypothetical protein